MTPEEKEYLDGAAARIKARRPDIDRDSLKLDLAKLLRARREKLTRTAQQPVQQQQQQQEPQQQSVFRTPVAGEHVTAALQTLEDRSASQDVMANEVVRAGDAMEAYKAQATAAALADKEVPSLSDETSLPRQLKQFIAAPVMTAAEKVLNVVDTPDRVWREQVTANEQGRDSELLDAALMRDNRGNPEDFLQATRSGKTLLSKGVRGVGTALGAVAAVANPLTAVHGLDALQDAGTMMASPTSFIGSGVGGARKGASDFVRALARSGKTLDKAQELKVMQLYEQLAETGPTAVGQIKKLFTDLGGNPAALEAVAGGENLARFGAGRYKIGLPFAQEKFGIEIGRLPADIIGKVTKGRVNLPEDLAGRAFEKIASSKYTGGMNQPKWSREMILGERAKAVYKARNEVGANQDRVLAEARHEFAHGKPKGPQGEFDFGREQLELLPTASRLPADASMTQMPLAAAKNLEGPALPPQKSPLQYGDVPQGQPGLFDVTPTRLTKPQRADDGINLLRIPPGTKRVPRKVPTTQPDLIAPERVPGQPFVRVDEPAKLKSMQTVQDFERDALESLRTGAKKRALESFDAHMRKHIPDVPEDVLEAGKLAFGELSKAQGIKFVGPMIRVFKQVRLYGNPAWAMLNAVEDSHKMMLSGIKNPKILDITARVRRAGPESEVLLSSPGQRNYTRADLKKIYAEQGATVDVANSRAADDVGIGSKIEDRIVQGGTLGIGTGFRIGNRDIPGVKQLDAFRESFFKQAFINDRLARGFSPNQAANSMRQVMFDMNVRPTTALAAKSFENLRDWFPFIGYTVRSMRAMPRLIAKNPGVAMMPIRAAQGAQAQSEYQDLPGSRVRNSGAFYNLAESRRVPVKVVLDAVNKAFGGEGSEDALDPAYALTVKRRGTAFDPFSSAESFGLDGEDMLSNVNPVLSLVLRHAFDRGPHWQADKGPTIPEALATFILSTPGQRVLDMLNRRYFGYDSLRVGYPTDYTDRKGFKKQNVPIKEVLGIFNSFSPYPVSLTSPMDAVQESSYSGEVKDATKAIKTFKNNARRL